MISDTMSRRGGQGRRWAKAISRSNVPAIETRRPVNASGERNFVAYLMTLKLTAQMVAIRISRVSVFPNVECTSREVIR
jgi:hypothetical protein